MKQLYKIIRIYRDKDIPDLIIKERCTLTQAQEHCNDLETSSTTCTTKEGKAHTEQFGPWFDGYEALPA